MPLDDDDDDDDDLFCGCVCGLVMDLISAFVLFMSATIEALALGSWPREPRERDDEDDEEEREEGVGTFCAEVEGGVGVEAGLRPRVIEGVEEEENCEAAGGAAGEAAGGAAEEEEEEEEED